jgi:hypothetical protein
MLKREKLNKEKRTNEPYNSLFNNDMKRFEQQMKLTIPDVTRTPVTRKGPSGCSTGA